MILATGTGRCGSSTVARLLHEDLGVCMGSDFDPPHPTWPQGNYEDRRFRKLHINHHAGRISLPYFRIRVMNIAAQLSEPWGFKDPRASYYVGRYREWLPEVRVIWCQREVGAVARSIHRAWGVRLHQARRETRDRWLALEGSLQGTPHLALDMNERRDEGELRATIGAWLEADPGQES